MSDWTYIGTRLHPRAGVLLKVGISNSPKRRAKELGIEIHALLPDWCESDIHRHLNKKRVWRDKPARFGDVLHTTYYPLPVFPPPTEWFYTDPVVGDWLRAYIAFARETIGLLAA